jgi:Flp pilus assembly protein TadG
MITRIRSRLSDRSGQSLVEFALVVPLVMLLILGIVDFGLAYNYKNDTTHLANEAARFAVVDACTPCGGQTIQQFVKSDADSADLENGTGQIQPPGVTIRLCFVQRPAGSPLLGTGPYGKVGDALEATATATYRFLPYLSLADASIVGRATQRVEVPYGTNGKYTVDASCPALVP